MVFVANVVKVLIASPGDTEDERNAVEGAISDWNASRAEQAQVVMLPWRWERHAVPRLGSTAQGVINEQAVDRADVVIALFDSRLGTETAEHVSGTAEEILRASGTGKPVHVYFSSEDLPRDVNLDQVAALREFKEQLGTQGLLGSYANPRDLAYQARNALEDDVASLALAEPKMQAKPGSLLVARHVYSRDPSGQDSKGKLKFRTTNELQVTNSGGTTAEAVTFEIVGGTQVHLAYDGKEFDLLPTQTRSWTCIPLQSDELTLKFTWSEGGHSHSGQQTISTRAH